MLPEDPPFEQSQDQHTEKFRACVPFVATRRTPLCLLFTSSCESSAEFLQMVYSLFASPHRVKFRVRVHSPLSCLKTSTTKFPSVLPFCCSPRTTPLCIPLPILPSYSHEFLDLVLRIRFLTLRLSRRLKFRACPQHQHTIIPARVSLLLSEENLNGVGDLNLLASPLVPNVHVT